MGLLWGTYGTRYGSLTHCHSEHPFYCRYSWICQLATRWTPRSYIPRFWGLAKWEVQWRCGAPCFAVLGSVPILGVQMFPGLCTHSDPRNLDYPFSKGDPVLNLSSTRRFRDLLMNFLIAVTHSSTCSGVSWWRYVSLPVVRPLPFKARGME